VEERRLVREFLRRFTPYFKDYVPRFVQAGIGVVMVAASTGAVTFLIEYVLDDIFIDKDRTALTVLPAVIVGLYLVQGLGRYAQTYQLAWIGEDIVRRIRNQLLGHVLSLDLAFFNAFRGGELISRITNDINRIRVAVSSSVAVVARESLVIVALIIVAIYKSPKLAFYGLVVLPAAAYPLWWLANRVKGLAHRSQEKDADITARLSEIFNNMEIIKAHHSEDFEAERFERDNLEFRRINMKGVRARELASPLMEFIGSIAVALVIWFGGLQVIEGHMTAGQFTSFATALFLLYTPIKRISVVYSNMFEAVAASERIFALMGQMPSIESGGETLDGPVESVEFRDVHLGYGDVEVLKGVSLTVARGETVALVGDSGGGKTSMVNLILRLYDPTSGQVLVNGIDTRELDLKSLRDRIGIVTQRVYIFNDTVAANVAYGGEHDRERVKSALTKAGAWGFVSAMKGGIDAQLDEFGANLSGGQRQRLAIARAVYKDPEILILDEATSALDNRTEAEIQRSLEGIIPDLITFVIAHRLTTVDLADRICVVSDGRIVGEGTKQHLMAGCPEYRRLERLSDMDDHAPHSAGAGVDPVAVD
jgi:subfamily B ATP-binding cassette protein MsbA